MSATERQEPLLHRAVCLAIITVKCINDLQETLRTLRTLQSSPTSGHSNILRAAARVYSRVIVLCIYIMMMAA